MFQSLIINRQFVQYSDYNPKCLAKCFKGESLVFESKHVENIVPPPSKGGVERELGLRIQEFLFLS